MCRPFLRGSALRKLEVADPGAPVKAGCRLVVLICVIKGAIVHRIDRYIAVVTPAVRGSTLAAGAIEKMLFA
jgi:hypothetical protein